MGATRTIASVRRRCLASPAWRCYARSATTTCTCSTFPINSITNGVHAGTWTSAPVARLFDRHLPEWRKDNFYLRYAIGIPLDEIRRAHAEAKRDLIAEVQRRVGVQFDANAMLV